MKCSNAHEEDKYYIAREESQRNAERETTVVEDVDTYSFVPADSEHSVTNIYVSEHEVSQFSVPASWSTEHISHAPLHSTSMNLLYRGFILTNQM
jgi:hypothetical protein